MSDSGQNMHSRFWDYAPEVDDSAIDKGWEKIKYFLPQKRKRRGFIFFRFPALARILAVLVLLLGGSVVFLNKEHVKEPSKTEDQPERSKEKKPAFKSLTSKQGSRAKAKVRSIQVKQPEREVASLNSTALPNKTNYQTKHKIKAQSPAIFSAASRHVQKSKILDPIPAPAEAEKELPPAYTDPPVANEITEEPWTFLKLKTLALPQSMYGTDSVHFVLSDMPLLPGPGPRRKFVLELMLGPNLSRTALSYNEVDERYKRNNNSAGLGAAYFFGDKWNLNGQFNYSENKLRYYHEKAIGNKVTGKNLNFLVPASVSPLPDTNIHYQEVWKGETLSAKAHYYFNLGIGYELFHKGRFSTELFVQLSMRSSKYSFSSETLESTDTLTYVRKYTSPPLANEISDVDPSYSRSFSMREFGLAPGLGFCYRVNKKASLIFKPSYFRQLSKGVMLLKEKDLRLKQDNLFFNLGLRLNIS